MPPLALLASLALPLLSNDPVDLTWPSWRGPARDGTVAGTAWPEALSAERLTLRWKVEGLGDSYASPIVTESTVFTVATVGKREEVARAYDRATGELRWEARWPGAMSVPFFAAKNGSWVRSTPAFDGDALYVGGMREDLVCLDAADGSVRWHVDLAKRFGTDRPEFGFVCSPLIVGDTLYVQAGAAVLALETRTGETRWRSTDAQGGGMDSAFSSPVLSTIGGREQLLVQSRTHLAGFDPADGARLWSVEVPAFRGMNILTPLVHGDAVFTTAYGGRAHFYAVSATAAEEGAPTWRVDERWTARAQGYMTSPVEVAGHAYLFLRSNRFTCVDLATGEDRWISPPSGDSYWSLVAQGGMILALADTGTLRLVAADPGAYRVLGEVELVAGPSWAHLAVVSPHAGAAPAEGEAAPAETRGADLFVRSQDALHAFAWR